MDGPDSASDRRPAIALVDHGTGNLTSLERGLVRGGAQVTRVAAPAALAGADAVVLPGVGAFPLAMASLQRLDLNGALLEWAGEGRPLLGVCLGMQLLFEGSDEAGGAEGLGLLAGRVRRIEAMGEPVPHIGWTPVKWVADHPLNAGLADPTPLYHVHSFVCEPVDETVVLATARHGETFTTAVADGATVGVQFHPEKSSLDGLALLGNFVRSVAARIGE